MNDLKAVVCLCEELRGEIKGIDTLNQQVSQPGLSNQQERLLGYTQTVSITDKVTESSTEKAQSTHL